jgi:hypothetical protein
VSGLPSTSLPPLPGERSLGLNEAGLFARDTETDRATPTVACNSFNDRGLGDKRACDLLLERPGLRDCGGSRGAEEGCRVEGCERSAEAFVTVLAVGLETISHCGERSLTRSFDALSGALRVAKIVISSESESKLRSEGVAARECGVGPGLGVSPRVFAIS